MLYVLSQTMNKTAESEFPAEMSVPRQNRLSSIPELPKASKEGLDFLKSIDEEDVFQYLFTDLLSIITDDGEVVGDLCICVSMIPPEPRGHPVLRVRIESVGNIGSNPCGTSITARLTTHLETLEQQVHEYIKLKEYTVERSTDIYKDDDQYRIRRIVVKDEIREVFDTSISTTNMEGFISEASNMILQKLFVRKGVPNNCVLLGLDHDASPCLVKYRSLGRQVETVEDAEFDVFGIERTLFLPKLQPVVFQAYFSNEGCLASRSTVDWPIRMKLTSVPSRVLYRGEEQSGVQFTTLMLTKKPLRWDTDPELHSKFLDRKLELNASHASYLTHHPDLRALVSDYMQQLLVDKPLDVLDFTVQYFAPFVCADTAQLALNADRFYHNDVAGSAMQMYNVQSLAPAVGGDVRKSIG